MGARQGAFLLRDGLLYRRAEGPLPERAVIPTSWRTRILQEFHDHQGHFSAKKVRMLLD